MQIVRRAGIDGRRGDHTDEGQKIGKRNDASFMVLFRAVLNQGVDRDNVESTRKTKCSQEEEHLKKTQTVKGDRKCKHRHADRAKRNEAVLDLSSRK